MSNTEQADGLYRVLAADADAGTVLVSDLETGERLRIRGTADDSEGRRVDESLVPGNVIAANVSPGDGSTDARALAAVEVRAGTTLHVTDRLLDLPMATADRLWERFRGEGSVVTTVPTDDGSTYDLELFPKNGSGPSVFEDVRTGRLSLGPWFDSLPASGRPAEHLFVVDLRRKPYVAVVGFSEENDVYETLLDGVRAATGDRPHSGLLVSEEPDSTLARDDRLEERAERPGGTAAEGTEWYTIGHVTVRPASPDAPGTYAYSDLDRRASKNGPFWVVHAAYWTVYLSLLFPIQYVIRALIWGFWKKRHVWNARIRAEIWLREGFENLGKLRFLWNPDRRVVYLRASRLYTPAQLLPFLSGSRPIPDDPGVERPPQARNWDAIRKCVYRRDGYHCVNCGDSGGRNGDAELHVDHVRPVSRGGSNEMRNLRTLCRACHEARHARTFN